MTCEPTGAAKPYSAFRLMCMPTARTLTRCSSFRASEARNVSLFSFVGQVVDVLAIFPQGHALIMVSAIISIAYPVRIADEQRSHLVLNAKVDDLPGSLMTQITDTTLSPATLFVLGLLQFLPPTGIFLAACLLLGKLSKLLIALPFEGTDTPSSDDQCLSGVGGDCGQMDFSQINRCLSIPWGMFRLRYLDTDMQLKAMIPDQTACPTVCWQFERKNQRGTSTTHWQYDPSALFRDSLSRPHHGIEPLGFPGILHLGIGRFHLPSGVHIGKKDMYDHLY